LRENKWLDKAKTYIRIFIGADECDWFLVRISALRY